ncbi:uncharacterized protein LOC112048561 [Bicyclus anynana]|uniref:Uncharacterized protein LOC112048561 n=1 Tax=Bicyclus anynana TaxID=110368 RepID=A0A6J1NFQ2_BICAN|nr:uncharacterized protein LOC112048561 [Bicyclus anynana]
MVAEDCIEERDIVEDLNVVEAQAPEVVQDSDDSPDDEDDSLSDPEPPDTESSQEEDDDDIVSSDSEVDNAASNWPLHERCVHGEINNISVPLDRSEVYCRFNEPYHELESLSKYHYREWSEVEHIFMPVIEFAEEMFGDDWSPCSSPCPLCMDS